MFELRGEGVFQKETDYSRLRELPEEREWWDLKFEHSADRSHLWIIADELLNKLIAKYTCTICTFMYLYGLILIYMSFSASRGHYTREACQVEEFLLDGTGGGRPA